MQSESSTENTDAKPQCAQTDESNVQPKQVRSSSWLITLACSLLFAFSLLSFPSVTPWVILFWIAWSSVQVARKQPGWLPLVACVITLLIRPIAFTPAMLILIVILFAAAIVLYRRTPNQLWHQAVGAVTCIAWIVMLLEWRAIENVSQVRSFDASRPIVCLGDSLTEGLHPDRGYPDALQSLVQTEIINLGFSGIAIRQGLDQMDRVLSHNPQVVVIELGGHDFLQGKSRAATKRNPIAMIDRCQAADADVILMEIPRGFIFDPFRSIEREVAYERDVQLISDTWLRQIVLRSPIAPPGRWMNPASHLSDDGIHSNARGSVRIAKRVAQALSRMYGDAALIASID